MFKIFEQKYPAQVPPWKTFLVKIPGQRGKTFWVGFDGIRFASGGTARLSRFFGVDVDRVLDAIRDIANGL
jgi:hypothetical protein